MGLGFNLGVVKMFGNYSEWGLDNIVNTLNASELFTLR